MNLPKILVTSLYDYPSCSLEGRLISSRIRPLSFLSQVDFYTFRDELMGHTEKIDNYFRIYRVPSHGHSFKENISFLQRAIKRQLESEDYNIIHIKSPWEIIPVLEYKPYLDSIIVYEVPLTSYDFLLDDKEQLEYKHLQHLALKNANFIIVSSSYTYKYLKEIYGNKTFYVPVGILGDAFDNYGITPIYDVIWNIDYAAPSQLEFMFCVFTNLIKIKPNASIIITGHFNHKFESLLKDAIKAFEISEHIKIIKVLKIEKLGFLTSISKIGIIEPPIDIMSHVWSDPSLKALEYLSSHTQALVPDLPYLDIINLKISDVYDPHNIQDTAKRLAWMLEHIDSTQWYLEKAYQYVRNNFTAGKNRREFIYIYGKLLTNSDLTTIQSQRDTSPTTASWEMPIDEITPISNIENLDIDLDDIQFEFEADAPLFSQNLLNGDDNDDSPK